MYGSESSSDGGWISWFIELEGHEFFVEVSSIKFKAHIIDEDESSFYHSAQFILCWFQLAFLSLETLSMILTRAGPALHDVKF